MSILSCTGPCDLYLGLYRGAPSSSGWGGGYSQLLTYPSTSSIKFLGHCEHEPQIELTQHYIALNADLNGGGFPIDTASVLETAQITLVLNKFNDNVYENYRSRPRSSGVPGKYNASDVGRLMIAEAVAIPLWVKFPYYGLKYSSFGMPQGYRFLATWVIGEKPVSGSKTRQMILKLQAVPVYDPTNGQWQLYDDNMSGLPDLPPTDLNGTIV